MQVHGSCAAREGAAVLVMGESGAGKSDLVFRLLDRGFDLVADDRVVLDHGWVSAPEALAGLIEVRGLGVLRVPHLDRARLALAVTLGAAPRLPAPQQWEVWPVPHLALDPRPGSTPQRLEWALDCVLKRRPLIEGAIG